MASLILSTTVATGTPSAAPAQVNKPAGVRLIGALASAIVGDYTEEQVPLPQLTIANQEQLVPELIERIGSERGLSVAQISLAQRIAMCESTNRHFNPETGRVLRGVHNSADAGIFQINEQYHGARSREEGYDIYAADGNIRYALWLMQEEGTRHWNWSKPCWGKQA